MSAVFPFHVDPGHGWLEVHDIHLAEVGLSPTDFSRFSYRRAPTTICGAVYYLEEDCDAPKFLGAYNLKYGHKATLTEVIDDQFSFIRQLPPIYGFRRGLRVVA